jgi:predicted PurR-regulated permease PerM
MNITKLASLFVVIIAMIVLLVGGKHLLIPFIVAFMVFVFIREIRYLLNKINFVRKHVPIWVLNTIAFLVIGFFITGIVRLISSNIQILSQSLQVYESNIGAVIESINSVFDVDILSHLKAYSQGYDYSVILLQVINSVRDIFGKTVLVLIYVLFILLEESIVLIKIDSIYPDPNDNNRIRGIVDKIKSSIRNYITLKTMTSFATGFLSYFALWFIGIDAPMFWAFLIFVLNYIPTIGSLIATAFPAIFALLQFGEFWPLLLVVMLVGAVQIVVGSIIEPRIMGDSFNISPLVVIISLSFWGTLWGIIGLVLSVPITVILIIIFAEFSSTRSVAIMLSENGKVGEPFQANSKIIR